MKSTLIASIGLASIAIAAPAEPNAAKEGEIPNTTESPRESSALAPPWYTSRPDPDWPAWLTLGVPGIITISIPFGPGTTAPGPFIPPYCGIDAFKGHRPDASSFCSKFLGGATTTVTQTYTARATATTSLTTTLTLPAPTATVPPVVSTLSPFTSSGPYPSFTASVSMPGTPSSSSIVAPPPPPFSTVTPVASSTPVVAPSSTVGTASTTTAIAPPGSSGGCGIRGYTKSTSAYYFDSSGTKNNFTACSGACKADAKCKSFGYGQTDCELFDVTTADNVNYNPMSDYTFYDATCPTELPVFARAEEALAPAASVSSDGQKIPFGYMMAARADQFITQVAPVAEITQAPQVSQGVGAGEQVITVNVVSGPADVSSACICLIKTAPAGVTFRSTVTVESVRATRTVWSTVTVTAGAGKREVE